MPILRHTLDSEVLINSDDDDNAKAISLVDSQASNKHSLPLIHQRLHYAMRRCTDWLTFKRYNMWEPTVRIVTVGSDASTTVMNRLSKSDGKPLSLTQKGYLVSSTGDSTPFFIIRWAICCTGIRSGRLQDSNDGLRNYGTNTYRIRGQLSNSSSEIQLTQGANNE